MYSFPFVFLTRYMKKNMHLFFYHLEQRCNEKLFLNFQLIFSEDFVRAMETEHHSNHFACKQCEKSLTGHRYILKEDQPYCLQCYEQVFANVCEECNEKIGCDSKVRNGSVIIWKFFPFFLLFPGCVSDEDDYCPMIFAYFLGWLTGPFPPSLSHPSLAFLFDLRPQGVPHFCNDSYRTSLYIPV